MSNSLRPHGLQPLAASVHRILHTRMWSGLPCPPPGDLPDPGTKLAFLVSPALAGVFFTTAAAKSLQSCPTLCHPRWQPTRLPRPWDSPGKNTGVGCHFLLQCMKVKSESEVAQSCPTLSHPMGCSPPGSSVRGIFQARVLEWGAVAFFTTGTTYIYHLLKRYILH